MLEMKSAAAQKTCNPCLFCYFHTFVLYMCVCARVRACVYVCLRVCVRVCVCAHVRAHGTCSKNEDIFGIIHYEKIVTVMLHE